MEQKNMNKKLSQKTCNLFIINYLYSYFVVFGTTLLEDLFF